jgi:hypothetical protein
MTNPTQRGGRWTVTGAAPLFCCSGRRLTHSQSVVIWDSATLQDTDVRWLLADVTRTNELQCWAPTRPTHSVHLLFCHSQLTRPLPLPPPPSPPSHCFVQVAIGKRTLSPARHSQMNSRRPSTRADRAHTTGSIGRSSPLASLPTTHRSQHGRNTTGHHAPTTLPPHHLFPHFPFPIRPLSSPVDLTLLAHSLTTTQQRHTDALPGSIPEHEQTIDNYILGRTVGKVRADTADTSRASLWFTRIAPHRTTLHHTTPHCTTPHHTTPHHTTPHHTTPHHTASHHTTPHHTAPHITSHHTTPHHITPHHTSHRTTSHHTTPHHTTPHHITSHHTTPHHITPHHTSHHITSHHTTPHHTTPHITSHHITPLHCHAAALDPLWPRICHDRPACAPACSFDISLLNAVIANVATSYLHQPPTTTNYHSPPPTAINHQLPLTATNRHHGPTPTTTTIRATLRK